MKTWNTRKEVCVYKSLKERAADFKKNNQWVEDGTGNPNQHQTRNKDNIMHTCYTRLMQEKGLSSWYIAVPLSWLPLIHGVLCLGLSVSSRGNIGSQNHRLRGMKTREQDWD